MTKPKRKTNQQLSETLVDMSDDAENLSLSVLDLLRNGEKYDLNRMNQNWNMNQRTKTVLGI